MKYLAVLFVAASIVAAFVPSASAHYVRGSAAQIKHGTDVLRFLNNHPRIARTPAARVVRKNHSWLRRHGFNTLSTREAICYVFGPYCGQALAVAYCETGGTYSVYATNGQYLGLFQMGNFARSTYGHGYTPYEQALAAYRYFSASGYDWSPWECKP